MNSTTHKCTRCGSTQLAKGSRSYWPNTFIPQGKWMWWGYNTQAFVCLSCGYLVESIGSQDLQKLQAAEKIAPEHLAR